MPEETTHQDRSPAGNWPVAQNCCAALESKLARALLSHFFPAECDYLIVTCVSAIAAFLTWHAFEVRFLELKEYFTYSTQERRDKPSAVSLDTHLPELTGVNS